MNKKSHKTQSEQSLINNKRDKSYKNTLKRIQKELNATDRIFSGIIHLKLVERISDTVEYTLARPNPILIGSITAFILTLAAYMISKKIGYQLSGTETIIAFAIGWSIGLIYDYLIVLFKGKRNSR
jgi:hypothetical protein